MSKIRRAHSVELLLRRFTDAELGDPDPMELIGIHDELARIERKWLMQIAEGSERRQPGDPKRLDDWFARLKRLIERALRTTKSEPGPESMLRDVLAKIATRREAPTSGTGVSPVSSDTKSNKLV